MVPSGKAYRGERDMAFQHAGEAVAHLGRGRAHDHRARHVGGAVGILRAGIDQEHLIVLDRGIGRAGDAVMHNGAVGAGAGNGIERQVGEITGGAAETFQRLRRGDFGQSAVRAPRARTSRESATAPRRRGYGPCACLRVRGDSCRPWAAGRDREAASPWRRPCPAGRRSRRPRWRDRRSRSCPSRHRARR